MSSTIDKVLLNTETHDEFIRQLMSSIVIAAKESANIPKGSDFTYYSMDSDFSNASKQLSSLTKDMMETICNYVKPNEITRLSDDLNNNSMLYDQIMDVVDLLLENADKSLDLALKEKQLSSSVRQTLSVDKDKLLHENEIISLKPQLHFMSEIDNSRNQPFRPRLTIKYHAITPLDNKIYKINEQYDHVCQTYESITAHNDDLSLNVYFPHPYETELRNLEYPSWCKDRIQHINPSPTYAQNACMYVDNEELFNTMLEELLDNIDELAIDLEHHSYHSFQGLTCLVQISSRQQDYIIDTLALRQSMPLLGQIFSNLKIVKVFHGCDKDILWLQRDFGLYVVNCFDTHIAAKALHYPVLSLAHLLRYHCDITADKKHQLSDWRIRPLSNEMLHYAQQDTKYLLYIYDSMRQELWKTLGVAGLEHVFVASKQLCLSRYEKETFNPEGYQMILQQDNKSNQTNNKEKKKSSKPVLGTVGKGINITQDDLSMIQVATLAAIWEWRDRIARDEDESCVAIMTNAELLRIGMNVPMNLAVLEQKCNPLSKYVREHVEDILLIIKNINSIGPTNTLSEYSNDTLNTNNVLNLNNTSNHQLRSSHKNIEKSLQQEETVYTFTPAILYPTASTPVHQRNNNHNNNTNNNKNNNNNNNKNNNDNSNNNKNNNNNNNNSHSNILPKSTVTSTLLPDVKHLNSPVPPVDEIFRQAGWSTPQSKGLYSPVIFDTFHVPEISTDNKKRMDKSMDDIHNLYASKNDFKNKLKDLASSIDINDIKSNYLEHSMITSKENKNNTIDINTSNNKIIDTEYVKESTYTERNIYDNNNLNNDENTKVGIDFVDIPKSFDEIYNLSIRNRQRNKEKKRVRDVEGNVDSSQEIRLDNNNDNNNSNNNNNNNNNIDVNHSNNRNVLNKTVLETKSNNNIESISIDNYFSIDTSNNNNNVIDTGLENTLSFASSLGWLQSPEEIELMRQNHIEDLNYQRNSELVDGCNSSDNHECNTTTNNNHTTNGNVLEKQSNHNQDINIIKDSHKQSSLITNVNAIPKAFNYSKITQHNSIGLLNNKADECIANNNTTTTTTTTTNNNNMKNNRKNNKNNKTLKNNTSSGNPFLFGTGK